MGIHGAADFDSARTSAQRNAVYVMLVGIDAAENNLINAVRQQTVTAIGVVLAVTNRRSKRGSDNVNEIEHRREQVRSALLGWQPPDAEGPVTYLRGRLLGFGDGTMWWQDEYIVLGMISS